MIGVAALAAALAWPILLTAVLPALLFFALDRTGLLMWSFGAYLACLILVVSPLPWLLCLESARDEPFMYFSSRHAVLYLGCGSALLVVILELSGLIIFGMATRRLSAWWSVALLWLAVLGFLSFTSAWGWVGDLESSLP